MTDTINLSKWTREKLVNEVSQLKIQIRESLNVTTDIKEENLQPRTLQPSTV